MVALAHRPSLWGGAELTADQAAALLRTVRPAERIRKQLAPDLIAGFGL